MSEQRRTRPDPRREATRRALIETAESMIAERGIHNVSARQVGVAIGSANNTVVAYHFGGMDALITAIAIAREQGLEKRRSELLLEVEAAGATNDPVALLRAMCQPLFELRNAQGEHSYARFLSSVFHTRHGNALMGLSPGFPTSSRLVLMIRAFAPPQVGGAYDRRWTVVVQMILDSLALIDWEMPGEGEDAARWFEEVLVIAAAALTARGPDLGSG